MTVLHPRKSNAASLGATLVSQAKDRLVVRVDVADRTDTIVLTPHGGSYKRGNASPLTLPMTIPGDMESPGM